MQSTTGCKINVAQPSGQDVERSIGLVGTRAAIEAAKRAIMDKVHAVVRFLRENIDNYLTPLQEEKNRPGGGSRRDDQYGDRYSQSQQAYQQTALPYGQQAQTVMPQGAPGGAADVDPYAMYGGIQNYYALWYAAAAQQGQFPGQQQQPGQAPQGQGPPGQSHPGAA